MSYRGHVDVVAATLIEGWIFDTESPFEPVRLELLRGRALVASFLADKPRQDLVSVHPSLDGSCAYSQDLSGLVDPLNIEPLTIRIAGTDLIVHTTADFSPSTRSSFGGLWIDRGDFIPVLGQKVRAGKLPRQMAALVVDFARDGYVILEDAVPAHVIDAVNADIDSMWEQNDPRVSIETFEPDGQLHVQPIDRDLRFGRTKLLDAYTVSSAARDAIFAPAIASFLEAIFETAPWAFQSLTVTKGPEQPIHKDSAYVKVVPPLDFAASWIALEDISEGSGELECLVGSHHWPDFLFAGHRKWMLDSFHEHHDFLETLQQSATDYNSPKVRFSAKKGDALIWHADLAHGDSRVSNANHTRKSQITHYCPRTAKPFYYQEGQSASFEHGRFFLSSERGVFHPKVPSPSKKSRAISG